MRWWRRVGGSGHLNVLKGHRLNVLKGHPGAPQAYLRRPWTCGGAYVVRQHGVGVRCGPRGHLEGPSGGQEQRERYRGGPSNPCHGYVTCVACHGGVALLRPRLLFEASKHPKAGLTGPPGPRTFALTLLHSLCVTAGFTTLLTIEKIWFGVVSPSPSYIFFLVGSKGDDARQMRQAEKDLFRYRREITLRFKIQERDLSLL